jgi:hypothetical protein
VKPGGGTTAEFPVPSFNGLPDAHNPKYMQEAVASVDVVFGLALFKHRVVGAAPRVGKPRQSAPKLRVLPPVLVRIVAFRVSGVKGAGQPSLSRPKTMRWVGCNRTNAATGTATATATATTTSTGTGTATATGTGTSTSTNNSAGIGKCVT